MTTTNPTREECIKAAAKVLVRELFRIEQERHDQGLSPTSPKDGTLLQPHRNPTTPHNSDRSNTLESDLKPA
jgi:hypothetical protein